MRYTVVLAIACAVLILAGCVEPVEELGCCVRENASDGCYLYNMTDYTFYDMIGDTIGACDDEDLGTKDHCNVSFGPDEDDVHLVPICTDDMLGTCFEPDCKAMVCGDYKYTPRVSPGFTTMADMEGSAPPESEDENTLNFYEAQCRFLDMDPRLASTMKNSNSRINVFRMGVGESFTEYDQYRYYFPMSDRFCNINNPLAEGDLRVDRYMNYVGPGYTQYDPIDELTDNCLVDDGSEVPPPFQFGYDSMADATGLGTPPYIYDITDPDRSGYKFREYSKSVIPQRSDGTFHESDLDVYNWTFKAIDEGYYRRALVIAYFEDLYGEGFGERAPFECNMEGYECYSGECDDSFYNRGAMLTGDPAEDPGTWEPLTTDCTLETDPIGHQKVVCLPTTDITSAPSVNYAPVEATPWQIAIDLDGMDSGDINEDDAEPPATKFGCCGESWCCDGDYEDHSYECQDLGVSHVCQLRWEWMDVTGNGWYSDEFRARWGSPGGEGYYKDEDVYYSNMLFGTIPEDFGYTRENPDEDDGTCESGCILNNGKCYCPYITPGYPYPPAAKIEFFGKFGENPHEQVRWDDQTVLGYAVMNAGDFDDVMVNERCNIGPDDYVQLSMTNPAIPDDISVDRNAFTRLMHAFLPYLNHRVDVLQSSNFEDGLGTIITDGDVVISSIPWVVAFKRGTWDGDSFFTETKFYNEPIDTYIRRNYLDQSVPLDYYDVSSEGLRAGYYNRDNHWYHILLANDVFLYIDKDEDGRLGDCLIDDVTGLPEMRTYGWCQPCTHSTLAYQHISVQDEVYSMYGDTDMEGKGARVMCTGSPDVSCFHPTITDIDVYQGELATIGAPRTIPEASYMKNKMEIFMRSGIMPVLDLSLDDNWNLTDPWGGTYLEYDSKKLLDNKGAMIVIVNIIGRFTGAEPIDSEEILERATNIRLSCPRCLTAVTVRSHDDELYMGALDDIFLDPRTRDAIDIITIEYSPNWAEADGTYTTEGALNRSVEFVQKLANRSRMTLVETGKPTIVTRFQVSASGSEIWDGTWADAQGMGILFNTLISNQDLLVKSGVMGIIFAPARSEYIEGDLGSDAGYIDDTDEPGYSAGIGYKTEKFCALQRASVQMTETPNVAIFAPMLLQDSVDCVPCDDLELARGDCMDGAMTRCDNGAFCAHSFSERNEVKCPKDTIVRVGGGIDCTLCSEIPGTFTCDYNYVDGTVVTKEYLYSEITSDAYADVIGGLDRPDKCCLVTDDGVYYSYKKTLGINALNRPVVFSKSGHPDMDCGVVTPAAGLGDATFCGYDMALKEYDINCTFEEGDVDDLMSIIVDIGGWWGLGGSGGGDDGGDGGGIGDGAPPVFDDPPIPIGDEPPPSDDDLPIFDDPPVPIPSDDDLPIVDEPPIIIIDDPIPPIIDEPPLPIEPPPSDGPPPDFGG